MRQIRPIVDFDRPARSAIEARDQCVAPAGISSSVAVMTSSTLSSRIDGGRPGRGSSASPSSRFAANLLRHLLTVAGSVPSAEEAIEIVKGRVVLVDGTLAPCWS